MADPAPETCSCSALRQAARHVTRMYDGALAPVGLGLNQYAILSRLNRYGPRVLQDLADLLVMDRSTLGHLLRPLETKGLVQIRVSSEDRRRRIIELTQTGIDRLREAKSLWDGAERKFEEAFGKSEALALRTILKKVEAIAFELS